MSANLDHIDLNSEALPVEPETDANGFNVSEPSAGVGVSVIGNLAELGYEKSRDSHAVNDEEVRREAVADELGGGGLEGNIVSLVRGFDMETEAGTLDEGSDAKMGGVNGDVEPGIDGEVEESVVGKTKSPVRGFDMESEIGSVDKGFAEVRDAAVDRKPGIYGEVDGIDGEVEEEEAHIVNSCQLEGLLTGGACASVYSSSIGDSIKVQNAHVLEYSPDNVGELHVTNTSEVVASDGLQNEEMEIDKRVDVVDDQVMSLNAPDPMVSQNDRDDFNPFNLVVDLNSCKSADGNGPDESNVQFASSEVKFQFYDLVWGKVRSHPWWPGQIFNPSAASKKAKKYFKNDSYLIAFFGDQTFAWNDVSKIKPFWSYFPQMEKQSNMESFLSAIDCALDEVARRVESGLACPCLSEESYSKFRTQIVNTGIREESRRDGGDSLPSVASLEPVKLLERIRAMALSPFAEFDRLEFVIAQAQVSAFYRLKGYCQLPEFTVLGRSWESDVETSLSGEVKYDSEVVETAASKFKEDEQLPGMEESMRPKGVSSKRKLTSEDGMHTTKKRKNLSDLMAGRQMHMSHGERGSEISSGYKVSSAKSGRKRKSVDSTSDDLEEKRVPSYLSKVNDNKSPQPRETFRVGKSILRVASQLNGSTPIHKNGDGTSRKTAMKKKSIEKVLSGKSYSERLILIKDCSPEEMLSQLRLAAQDPMNGYRFLTSGISFFMEFCDSVSPECINPENDKQLELEVCGNDTEKDSKNSGICETSELEGIKDSYWPVRIVQSMPEEPPQPENQTEAGDFLPKTPSEKCSSAIELQATVQSSPDLDSKQCTGGGTRDLGSSGPLNRVENSCGEDLSPTALILNFTDIDSVPSEANLNNIFGQYGPLRESETQVLRKSSRAKVVFKRRADAETAFSSAGKYSIFGPSLVSYRLKYMQSTASKASGSIKRQIKKGSTSVEENEN
ncbi:PWWP domain-containing family protein [Tripterygium wilfordii]|uniref:PWWP domain-containing family protein n=1 Tax=Tripterygium wilfordii TaxID=458696 RepID=A0A7J7DVL5_TRIWF|nr:uncharacterized protein LOC119995002 [Tripterygium wilfordii]KAF5750357.1 PWWP domain-containing family protein [Tripterygium wilfordii]